MLRASLYILSLGSDDVNLEALRDLDVDQRLRSLNISGNRFYDSESHRSMFNVPKFIREILASTREVSTLQNPVYVPA